MASVTASLILVLGRCSSSCATMLGLLLTVMMTMTDGGIAAAQGV